MKNIMKKGQVTIFAVLGLVLLITMGLFFFITKELNAEKDIRESPSFNNVEYFIQSCIELASSEVVTRNSNFNGIERFLEKEDLPDNIANSKNVLFYRKEPIFLEKESVELTFSKLISKNLDKCVDISIFHNEFEIQLKNKSVNTTIEEKFVIVSVSWPIKITKGKTTRYLELFQYKVDVPLNKVINKINNLLERLNENPYVLDIFPKDDDTFNVFISMNDDLLNYDLLENSENIDFHYYFGFQMNSAYNREPPRIILDQTSFGVEKGEDWNYQVIVADPDDELYYDVNSPLVSMDSDSGLITLIDSSTSGIYSIDFSVTNSEGFYDEANIILTVRNDGSSLRIYSTDQFILLGQKLSYKPSIVAQEATSLEYDYVVYDTSQNNIVFTQTDETLTWTPTEQGEYIVDLTVSDDEISTSDLFGISVISQSNYPPAVLVYDQTINLETTLSIKIYFFDRENDELKFSFIEAPDSALIDEFTGEIFWQPTEKGEFLFVLSITDTINTISESFTVVVE